MKQPRERFERSLPDSGLEQRMRELLDSFKAEVLEKFQEHKEKNAEQDLKIARQSETISKLEETIAEQQKTIEEQNETIQKIDMQPDSGKTVRCCKIINRKSESLSMINNSFTVIILKIPRHSDRGSLCIPERESSIHHRKFNRRGEQGIHRDLPEHQRLLATTSAIGQIRSQYLCDIGTNPPGCNLWWSHCRNFKRLLPGA